MLFRRVTSLSCLLFGMSLLVSPASVAETRANLSAFDSPLYASASPVKATTVTTDKTVSRSSANGLEKLRNPISYQRDAQQIKAHYQAELYTLKPYTFGHFGVRLYRQTGDEQYELALWVDLARVANKLNKLAAEVHTPEQIRAYSLKKLAKLKGKKGERSERRYAATQAHPDYFYLGLDLLAAMARSNEFGAQHQQDALLREILSRYDFAQFATDPEMIKAWAAQLANQVFWLRQLGGQDVVEPFITAFRQTYPDDQDHLLSDQQFNNKIYGLSHIIFAASQYYLTPVNEADYQWLFDYYRANIKQILRRCKEDVIAEVGLNFLLAQLPNDPVLHQTQARISQAIDHQAKMIPSVGGSFDLERGEHRNVLAIMLLDWQGFVLSETQGTRAPIALPYGLVRLDAK